MKRAMIAVIILAVLVAAGVYVLMPRRPAAPPEVPFTAEMRKQMYAGISKALRDVDQRVDLSAFPRGGAIANGLAVLGEVLQDSPEIFYATREDASIDRSSSGPVEIAVKYRYAAGEVATMKASLAKKCAEIIAATVNEGMGAYDKEIAIHDQVVKGTVFDFEGAKSGSAPYWEHTAYGVLVAGRGVADGYAKAFQLLLAQAGIEARFVSGQAVRNKSLAAHAWNIVKLDGKYYHVDVALDDPAPETGDFVSYNYFNADDRSMSASHRWDTSKFPPCVDEDLNYFVNNGLVVHGFDELCGRLKDGIVAKKSHVLVRVAQAHYDPKVFDPFKAISVVMSQTMELKHYADDISTSNDEEMGVMDIRLHYALRGDAGTSGVK